MAEIRDVQPDGTLTTPTPPSQPNPKGVLDGEVADPLELAVEQMMDLGRSQNNAKVKALVEWAKSVTDDHTPENIKWTIRDLEFKVGSPAVGQKMIDYLYTYVGLIDQKKEVDTQLNKYNPYGK